MSRWLTFFLLLPFAGLPVGFTSAQDPSVIAPAVGARSEREIETPRILGADVLSSMDSLDQAFTLSAGDRISIRVLEDRRPAVSCRVSPSGAVTAPYIGHIQAAGLTSKELALKVKARLEEKKFLPVASVVVAVDQPAEIKTFGCPSVPDRVVVSGAVARPGIYEMAYFDLTVSSLIHHAGGHTSPRKSPKIMIIRKTPQGNRRILVNTRAALNGKGRDYDLFLRKDDVILVE